MGPSAFPVPRVLFSVPGWTLPFPSLLSLLPNKLIQFLTALKLYFYFISFLISSLLAKTQT